VQEGIVHMIVTTHFMCRGS